MMHACAHVMQCNYGAKHLRCYNLGDVGHVESHFDQFGDSISVSAR
jgi:hypothetical protein